MEKAKKLRLYVWKYDVDSEVDYLVFVLAHSVKEARQLVKNSTIYISKLDAPQNPKVKIYDGPICFSVWGTSEDLPNA